MRHCLRFALLVTVTLVTCTSAGEAQTASQANRLAAGGDLTCALTPTGVAKCWGDNRWGQIGNGSHTEVGPNRGLRTPSVVRGLGARVRQIATGYSHACAITRSRAVRCWGEGNYGQIGNGHRHGENTRPSPVRGLAGGAIDVATGRAFSCALTRAGAVRCWGSNNAGQLGNRQVIGNARQMTAVPVTGLQSGVVAIDAGESHACALLGTGVVKCWGTNFYGQLGTGSRAEREREPIEILGLPAGGVAAIDAGDGQTCALTKAGGVKCWGAGWPLPQDVRRTPTDVPGLTNGVTAISAGGDFTCALTNTGGVKCWGLNDHGQLGIGHTTDEEVYVPTPVAGLQGGVIAISAGSSHACALLRDGGIKCWGAQGEGQLGDGGPIRNSTPRPVDVRGFAAQTLTLSASRPPGTLARGTPVAFTAVVRPIAAGTPAVVRFEIYQQRGGSWALVSAQNVTGSPNAQLAWTFTAAGSWYVRARALANGIYAASPWSPALRYSIR
jgi:alpha-tubulin suppressor-like RCC1 family protein